MSIQRIPSVTINGSNKMWGGYIYSVDYSIPQDITSGPSEMTLSFAAEDKSSYYEPTLSFKTPYLIRVGNIFQGSFYPVDFLVKDSNDGKILEVTFWDGSHVLSKYWVGLHKKMGDKTKKNNPSNLILLGTELHPCDINEDGVYDTKDIQLLAYDQKADPCELFCPQREDNTQPIETICREKEVTQIFDVAYTFKNLLDAIRAKNIPIKNAPKALEDNYFGRYTGKLRDVLNDWCADYGFTYIWQNGLYFIDCRQPIDVNLQQFSNLKSLNYSKSIRNTIGRGSISYFGQPGVVSQSDCSKSEAYLLHCLTLRELYGEFYTPNRNRVAVTQSDQPVSDGALSPPEPSDDSSNTDTSQEYLDGIYQNGVPINNFEQSCVCSYYHEDLRTLYNFFLHYDLKSADAAIEAKGKWMDRLGRMHIIEVFNSGGPKDTFYKQILNDSIFDGKPLFVNDFDKSDFVANGGYFALVVFDEELLKKQYEIEQRLARGFIGQHWVRPFRAPFIGDNPQVTPQGTYYGALSTDLNQIPFSQFQHSYKSYVGKMVNAYSQVQKNDFKVYGQLRFSRNVAQQNNTKLLRSLIYMGKNPVWNPTEITNSDFQSLLNDKSKILFKKFDGIDASILKETFRNEVDFTKINAANIKQGSKQYLHLFAFFPGDLKMSYSMAQNPYEENLLHRDDVENYQLVTYGLNSKQTVKYQIEGIPIYMPASSSVRYSTPTYFSSFSYLSRTSAGSEQSKPAYKVYVTTTAKNRGIIPKIESTYISAPPSSEVAEVEYLIKDIDKNNLKYLISPKLPACVPDTSLLQEYHEKFNANLNFSTVDQSVSYEYELIGVTLPNGLDIINGLEGVNISINGDTVVTRIKVGNSLFRPPSKDYLVSKVIAEQSQFIQNSKQNPL